MPTQLPGGQGVAEPTDERSPQTGFAPTISLRDVLREMILDEVRSGELTKSRRRRIVRYSASMGLNAVQAGRLIEECRAEAFEGQVPEAPCRQLRLVPAPEPGANESMRLWVAVALAILADIVILWWVW